MVIKCKCETLLSSVTLVECPVRAFAPRKGHPPMDTPQSGAGTWQLATPGKLGSTSSPAAPRFPPGFTPKQSIVVFLLLSVVASEATKTNAASSEGGRGWSVARATAIFTSKMLARFRALAQNQARGGRWKLNVFADKEFHPPSARQPASPAISSDPTSKQSWERSQAAAAPPCNAPK